MTHDFKLVVEKAAIDLEAATGYERAAFRDLLEDFLLRAQDVEEGAREFCACGVFLPDVTDGISDHKGECRALDFKSAIELLAVGADDTQGWMTPHLEEAQRLVARYPRIAAVVVGPDE